jgi:hypothetical protein
MNVSGQVTPAEMREAIRLNLTFSTVMKLGRTSGRLFAALLVLFCLIFTELFSHKSVDWGKLGIFVAVVAVIGLLMLFKFRQTAARTSRVLSKASMALTIDGNGLTRKLPNGTCTSIPWSAIPRWREGELVFTLGAPGSYTVISKAALGQLQAGELRSILLSQVRFGAPAQALSGAR